jgi:hypothetical protein
MRYPNRWMPRRLQRWLCLRSQRRTGAPIPLDLWTEEELSVWLDEHPLPDDRFGGS